jgi:hypothetical protein
LQHLAHLFSIPKFGSDGAENHVFKYTRNLLYFNSFFAPVNGKELDSPGIPEHTPGFPVGLRA